MSWTQHIRHAVKRRLFTDPGELDRTVLIVGSGRSGTTWLGDLIARPGLDRVMFEPFRADLVPQLGGWPLHRYLRCDNKDPLAKQIARRVLTGQLRNRWVDQTDIPWQVERRIIKDIRCNLMLGWLHQTFTPVPIVLLIRHPCAVAASRHKMGWASTLAPYLDQRPLIDDHLTGLETTLNNVSSPFLQHVLAWCIETRVALRQLNPGDATVIFYEDLCDHIDQALAGLLERLGLEKQRAQVNPLRPSAMSHAGSAVVRGEDRVRGWRAEIDDEQIEQALALVNAFGLDGLYGRHERPQVRGEATLALVEV